MRGNVRWGTGGGMTGEKEAAVEEGDGIICWDEEKRDEAVDEGEGPMD